MTAIPVMLDFYNLTGEYDLCICLSTPNVSWSLAGEGVCDQGFSYNAATFNDSRAPCLRRLQVRTSARGSVLELGVNPSSGASSFTLTCYLDVPSTASCIEGFCKLGSDVVVSARIGDAEAVEWCDGQIRADLYPRPAKMEKVVFDCVGLAPGSQIKIDLTGRADEIEPCWIFATNQPGIAALSLAPMPEKVMPISSIIISKSRIEFYVSVGESGQDDCGFTMEIYFSVAQSSAAGGGEGNGCVLLHTDYMGEGWLAAKIGRRLPKLITNNIEEFFFDGD